MERLCVTSRQQTKVEHTAATRGKAQVGRGRVPCSRPCASWFVTSRSVNLNLWVPLGA